MASCVGLLSTVTVYQHECCWFCMINGLRRDGLCDIIIVLTVTWSVNQDVEKKTTFLFIITMNSRMQLVQPYSQISGAINSENIHFWSISTLLVLVSYYNWVVLIYSWSDSISTHICKRLKVGTCIPLIAALTQSSIEWAKLQLCSKVKHQFGTLMTSQGSKWVGRFIPVSVWFPWQNIDT